MRVLTTLPPLRGFSHGVDASSPFSFGCLRIQARQGERVLRKGAYYYILMVEMQVRRGERGLAIGAYLGVRD